MTALTTEARCAFRELQSRGILAMLLSAAFIGFTFAALERRAFAAFALDRALLSSTFGLLVPVCCFVVLRRLIPERPEQALFSAAQFGANRRTAFFGRALVLFGVQAALGTCLAVLTLAAAGSVDWTRELGALLWIAPLGTMAHGAAQLLGTTLGRHGALLVLGCDWVLGSTQGPLAVMWPRAHLRNLLGGAPPLDLSQAVSALALTAIVVACVFVARLRIAR